MKTKYLDAVIAAGHASRSVALATDIGSGAQLLDSRRGHFDPRGRSIRRPLLHAPCVQRKDQPAEQKEMQ